jgi:hypothetical protein
MICLLIVPLIVAGCGNPSEELQNRNNELTRQLAEKDQFINEVTGSLSEIYGKVETAWAEHKKVVRAAESVEGGVTLTRAQMKERVLDRITGISAALSENRKKVNALERRLKESGSKYTGLEKLVEELKTTIHERDQSIVELWERIRNLETDVVQKADIIAAHEETIRVQEKRMTTVYYVVGTRDTLKNRGIIAEEGGFPWGLFGSTTTLASNLDDQSFSPLDVNNQLSIAVHGEIDEIVPKRDEATYTQEMNEEGVAVLRIVDPQKFWQQRHLVIVSN